MTKTEVLTAVKNRIDEVDEDTQIDNIIETAFDYCYRKELGELDKRITTAYIPVVDGVATLPSDLMDIEAVTPALTFGDRRVGNSIITSNTGLLSVIYSYVRPAIADADELDMDIALQYLIVLYCCAAFYEHKKKTETAMMYSNEYESKKRQYVENSNDYIEEGVVDVYGTGGDE